MSERGGKPPFGGKNTRFAGSMVSSNAINAEPDAAEPLPLNSGGGAALVDCRHGACVVAYDGIACIATVLRMWDRRRCINPKCMRQAKKWFVSQFADQLMPMAI